MPGLLLAALGAGLVYRGASGHCSVYDALGIDSRDTDGGEDRPQSVQVVESFLVDKPVDELYTFWRDLENLPAIMSHLETVEVIGRDDDSHWIARAPRIAGGSVEWDAEIVEERPNERIAWRSLPDRMSTTKARWSSNGHPATGEQPGARENGILRRRLGGSAAWFAKLFGENPESQIREDLRRFKRVMEIGENITTKASRAVRASAALVD